MKAQKSNEESIFFFGTNGLAFINRIANREESVWRPCLGVGPARRDRDSFHCDFPFSGGEVDPSGLRPSAVQRFGWTCDVMAAFGFSHGQRRQVWLAGDPIRKIPRKQAFDFDSSAPVQVDCPAAEMSKNGEIEVLLEISASDEAAK
ncbi:hypothetical protein XH99_00740 [Bradyrhizobium nanningense]|uniref:Uncharacterized protein n=1 Tax=Bradyrhizobium nanningense TaxID=1325118 RepID=A0A4Q0SKP3_9BRAD|nr:hypothetical protein XH99_00740 [Bradyrhizobium nanningense]